MAEAARVREATVSLGVDELDSGAEPLGRTRRPGGGRKQAADLDSGLRPALLALVEPEERGDPMSPLRWTTKPTRNLAAGLTRRVTGSVPTPLVTCCGPRGSACRATPRPSRAGGTRTGTRSPGTSKWNKAGHRLFSHITMNWRGRPLTSHEVIVQTIAATTTRTIQRVRAELDASA